MTTRPANVVPPPSLFGVNLEPYVKNLPAPAQRLVSLAVTTQFAWFAGHFTTAGLVFLLKQRGNLVGHSGFYRALLGTIVSYGIVLYRIYGVPTTSNAQQFADRLLRDENFQYLLLAIVWYFSPALSILLVPFFVFSLFHVLLYFRTAIIPAIGNPTLSNSVSPYLQSFVSEYQPKALKAVAYFEVVAILPILIVGMFFRWSNIYQPIMFAQFLRFRYGNSKTTGRAFATVRGMLDRYLDTSSASGVPAPVKQYYVKARDAISSLGAGAGPEATIQPAQRRE